MAPVRLTVWLGSAVVPRLSTPVPSESRLSVAVPVSAPDWAVFSPAVSEVVLLAPAARPVKLPDAVKPVLAPDKVASRFSE